MPPMPDDSDSNSDSVSSEDDVLGLLEEKDFCIDAINALAILEPEPEQISLA